MTPTEADLFIYFRAPHVSVMWDDVVRCVVLQRGVEATDRDLMTARGKVLTLLRAKRAKRCMVHTIKNEKIDTFIAEMKAAGMRALAIIVPDASDVTIDFRASIARINGDVATRCFDVAEHARLWLVTAASARHSSKPLPRVSMSMKVTVPARISIRPSKWPRPSRAPRGMY